MWVDRESFVSNIGQTQGAANGLEGRPQRVPGREGVAVVGKKQERVRGNWIRRYWPHSSTCRAVRRGPDWPDGEGGPGVYGGNGARRCRPAAHHKRKSSSNLGPTCSSKDGSSCCADRLCSVHMWLRAPLAGVHVLLETKPKPCTL